MSEMGKVDAKKPSAIKWNLKTGYVYVPDIPGFRVKEGLSCVLFRTIVLRKTRNLSLPCIENPVGPFLARYGSLLPISSILVLRSSTRRTARPVLWDATAQAQATRLGRLIFPPKPPPRRLTLERHGNYIAVCPTI